MIFSFLIKATYYEKGSKRASNTDKLLPIDITMSKIKSSTNYATLHIQQFILFAIGLNILRDVGKQTFNRILLGLPTQLEAGIIGNDPMQHITITMTLNYACIAQTFKIFTGTGCNSQGYFLAETLWFRRKERKRVKGCSRGWAEQLVTYGNC